MLILSLPVDIQYCSAEVNCIGENPTVDTPLHMFEIFNTSFTLSIYTRPFRDLNDQCNKLASVGCHEFCF